MEIDFSVLLHVLLKRLWILILGAVVAAVAAYGYCEYLVTPQYTATASIMVTNGAITAQSNTDVKTSVSATDITASLDLVETVTDILKTPETYRETAEQSGGKYTYAQIVNTASVKRRSETTLFIDISFKSADKDKAIDIANLFSKTSCKYITKVIPYSNAIVVAKANSAVLVYPSTFSTMAISALVTVLALYVIFFFLENNNKVIRSEEDFTKNFDVPIIGSVPDFENSDTSAYTIYKKGR